MCKNYKMDSMKNFPLSYTLMVEHCLQGLSPLMQISLTVLGALDGSQLIFFKHLLRMIMHESVSHATFILFNCTVQFIADVAFS